MNKTEENIALLWRGLGWSAIEAEFPLRVEESRKLVEDLECSFSPAQLIRQLTPLSSLPKNLKGAMEDMLQNIYLRRSGITEHKQPLGEAVDSFEQAFGRFRTAWAMGPSKASERELRASWSELLKCAGLLRDELDKLPRGIVLP